MMVDEKLRDAALLDRWSFKRGTLRERLEWAQVQHALSVDDDSVPLPRTLEAHREWHRLCAVWYAEMVRDLDAALATERRNTVERIRELTGPLPEYRGDVVPILEGVTRFMDALAEVGEGEA